MKLQDLAERFKKEKIIRHDVYVGQDIIKLKYEGATVTHSFNCSHTAIRSLKGSPTRVNGGFHCDHTKITSLDGAPQNIGNSLYCDNTKITSLHNVHKQIKYIGGSLVLSRTVESNIIGVMLIKGLNRIYFPDRTKEQKQVEDIINKHLQGDRDVHACQEELLEAGLGDYAKL